MKQIISYIYPILRILDNNTVAGIITVIVGGLVGYFVYNGQKQLDREYVAGLKLAEVLFLLREHCQAVNQSIDRIVNTYLDIKNSTDDSQCKQKRLENLGNSLDTESQPMAKILMNQIPEDVSQIKGLYAIYFMENKMLGAKIKTLFESLKSWHDFVKNYPIGKSKYGHSAFDKRVGEVPELSLEELNKNIKDAVELI